MGTKDKNMKLTILNYNVIAGVKLVPGWELTEVKEYEEQYEFCCLNMTTGENRYLRLDRKHVLNDKFCWTHSVNRAPDMKLFSTWAGAIDEIEYELNWVINTIK